MKQIVPGLHTFGGLLVGRVYLTEDADGLSLIDTSLRLTGPKILQQLRAAGHAPGDVRRIIITHAHPDHIGGLPALRQATGAEVIASYVERPYVEGKAPIPRPPKDSLPFYMRSAWQPPAPLPGTPVDRDVADGEMIPETLGGLQVILTPGHSPGQMSLWQPERRILITGDAVANLPPWGLRLPFTAFTPDMAEARRSVQKLAALEPALICFGHGVAIGENAAARLRRFAESVR